MLVVLNAGPLRAVVQGFSCEQIGAADPAALQHWAELVHLHAERITRPDRLDERLWRVWAAVDADLARRWTVEDLAALAGVGGEHLRRLCRRELGRSSGHHLTHLRMQRATYLLRATGWTVEAVTDSIGDEDPFAFSTAFKRWAGVTPSGYRAGRLGGDSPARHSA